MKYYKFNGNIYQLKESKVFDTILLFLFSFVLGYFYYTGEKSNDIPIWVFGLIPILIFLFKVGRQVRLRTDPKELEIAIFGIPIQRYSLLKFRELYVIKHRTNFIKNGKEVKAVFIKKENILKEISILRKNKFSDIEAFIKETEAVVKTITNS